VPTGKSEAREIVAKSIRKLDDSRKVACMCA
jgi:hypothetical protein